MQITVVTYNMHHGRGTDGRLDLHRIAAVLGESGADLIGLNEVDRFFSKRSDYLDQAAWLADRLNMHCAFGAAVTVRARTGSGLRQFGNALLSRYPIVTRQNHPFALPFRLVEARALLETGVAAPWQPLRVYVTHLSLLPFLHRQQTDFLVNRLAAERQPVILLGDWNMRPGCSAWRKISRHLTDVCQAAGGRCYTFPSQLPRAQFDYIFVSCHFQVVSAETLKKHATASDHLPLVANLRLQGEQG